jgi:aryl-alcohol dehydrogenase-like predicted oxidoreductase
MEYRRLGRSGLEVSIVCLGTMMFGDRTNAREASEIVAHAEHAGVNFVDTADVYANGASETITGDAIRARRQRWILATKLGNVMPGAENARPFTGGSSRRWILAACDASLTRLRTDYVDVYYLHRDDPDTPLDETVAAIGALIEAGKIRYFGVSNFRGWRIAEVIRCCDRQVVPPPVVCQPYYNLLTRLTVVDVLAACVHYGICVAR